MIVIVVAQSPEIACVRQGQPAPAAERPALRYSNAAMQNTRKGVFGRAPKSMVEQTVKAETAVPAIRSSSATRGRIRSVDVSPDTQPSWIGLVIRMNDQESITIDFAD
jgi:hypothetical protein